jgi:hypothetical protein
LIDVIKHVFLYLEKQLETSLHPYERVNRELVSNNSIRSMKQPTNVVKAKENLKSKYLQIESEGKQSSINLN